MEGNDGSTAEIPKMGISARISSKKICARANVPAEIPLPNVSIRDALHLKMLGKIYINDALLYLSVRTIYIVWR
jgi:hypothetical protein